MGKRQWLIFTQVTRDPIERYVSSFHSKITCKGEKGDGGGRPRVRGYQDLWDNFAPGLQALAGLKERHPCLYWSEYVDVLTRIKKLGRQRDAHNPFRHGSTKNIICVYRMFCLYFPTKYFSSSTYVWGIF